MYPRSLAENLMNNSLIMQIIYGKARCFYACSVKNYLKNSKMFALARQFLELLNIKGTDSC